MLINDHRPCRQIYDHGGYKETWDNAASHLGSYRWHSRAGLGFAGGHGGDDEEEMEKYEEAGERWTGQLHRRYYGFDASEQIIQPSANLYKNDHANAHMVMKHTLTC